MSTYTTIVNIRHTNGILHVGHNRHSGLHASRQEAQEAHKAQQHSCSASSCSNSSRMEGISDPRSGRAEWICRCCSFPCPCGFALMNEFCALLIILCGMLGQIDGLPAQSPYPEASVFAQPRMG